MYTIRMEIKDDNGVGVSTEWAWLPDHSDLGDLDGQMSMSVRALLSGICEKAGVPNERQRAYAEAVAGGMLTLDDIPDADRDMVAAQGA